MINWVSSLAVPQNGLPLSRKNPWTPDSWIEIASLSFQDLGTPSCPLQREHRPSRTLPIAGRRAEADWRRKWLGFWAQTCENCTIMKTEADTFASVASLAWSLECWMPAPFHSLEGCSEYRNKTWLDLVLVLLRWESSAPSDGSRLTVVYV